MLVIKSGADNVIRRTEQIYSYVLVDIYCDKEVKYWWDLYSVYDYGAEEEHFLHEGQ